MQGAGCRVRVAGLQGAGFVVQGAGCRVQGAGCRVQGAGGRGQGAGGRVRGAGLGDLAGRSRLLRPPPPLQLFSREEARVHADAAPAFNPQLTVSSCYRYSLVANTRETYHSERAAVIPPSAVGLDPHPET